jgi:hypothetical protein
MPMDQTDPTVTIRFSPKKLLLVFTPLAVLVLISLIIKDQYGQSRTAPEQLPPAPELSQDYDHEPR